MSFDRLNRIHLDSIVNRPEGAGVSCSQTTYCSPKTNQLVGEKAPDSDFALMTHPLRLVEFGLHRYAATSHGTVME